MALACCDSCSCAPLAPCEHTPYPLVSTKYARGDCTHHIPSRVRTCSRCSWSRRKNKGGNRKRRTRSFRQGKGLGGSGRVGSRTRSRRVGCCAVLPNAPTCVCGVCEGGELLSPLHPKWGPAVPTCPRCFGSEIDFDKVRTPSPAHPSPLHCVCLLPPFEAHCSHMLFCVWQVRILVVFTTTGQTRYLLAQIFRTLAWLCRIFAC